MKKISFICLTFLLGLGLASCSDDYEEWASPLHNDQEEPVTISGFTATAADPIDLEAVGDAKTVTAFNLNTSNLPDGYSISGVDLVLTPTDASARNTNPSTLSSTVDLVSHAGSVSVDDLANAISSAYGTARVARNFAGRVLLTVTTGSNVKLSNIDAGTVNLKVTPVAPDYPDYLYENGDNNGWGGNGSLVLTPSANTTDEPGVFYGAFYLPEMPYGFKFSSVFGGWPSDMTQKGVCNLGADASATEGVLVNDGGSGNLNVAGAGFYWIKVDVINLTYSFTKFDHIALIGDATPGGWNDDTALAYDADNHVWYANNVTLTDGSFKLRADNSWDIVDFGGSLDKLQKGASNINVTAGTYNIRVHLENTTEAKDPYIELTPVN